MDLQNVFYSLSIIFMSLSILILVGIAVLVFYILKKVTELEHTVERKLHEFTQNPAEAAIDFGTSLANTAIKKLSGGRRKN